MTTHPLIRSVFIALLLMAWLTGAASAASPGLHEVYQAAEAGKLAEAQRMMTEVLKEHPNSAKAHFVEAELYARAGDFKSARQSLKTAEQLSPGLSFAKPEKVESLRQLLNTPAATTHTVSSAAVMAAPQPPADRFPWGWLVLGGGAIALVIWLARRPRPAATGTMAPVTGSPVYGNAAPAGSPWQTGFGTAPAAPAAGGMGSSLLGGLATGAAVGAGIVAGEALMHRVLGDQPTRSGHDFTALDQGSNADFEPIRNPAQNYDMGGEDFGVSGDSWDDGGSSSDWDN